MSEPLPTPDVSPPGANGAPVLGPPPIDDGAGLSDIARQRREQILTAAEAIIAEEGIDRLSLARIENRVGIRRGHLTYYFPTKESILLAVFDRMLRRMVEGAMARAAKGGTLPPHAPGDAWHRLTFGLHDGIRPLPPDERAFGSLVYTFLAQANHRDDFRAKLAVSFEHWRQMLTADIAATVPDPVVPPRVLACIVQSVFHGITMQLAVDPGACDPAELADACVRMFAPLFRQDAARPHSPPPTPPDPTTPPTSEGVTR